MSCEKLCRPMALQTDREDFLSHILPSEDLKRLTMPELEATTALLIMAGSESTSTQMTATTNYLVRNPAKLAKLVTEIRSAFQCDSDITLRAVENLVYLKAVLQEGMRLGPPVPTRFHASSLRKAMLSAELISLVM
jgi:cytochrome P450